MDVKRLWKEICHFGECFVRDLVNRSARRMIGDGHVGHSHVMGDRFVNFLADMTEAY